MSNKEKESKVENVVKWVVVTIFAGIVGLVVWSPFHAQDRDLEQLEQKLKEIEQQSQP